MTGLKVRVTTPLFERCLDFYTELLGMKILESWDGKDDRGAILGLNPTVEGEAFLELAYGEEPRDYEGLSLQFRVADLKPVVEKLQGVVEFRGPEPRPWGSQYLYVSDPCGLSIIIYQGEI